MVLIKFFYFAHVLLHSLQDVLQCVKEFKINSIEAASEVSHESNVNKGKRKTSSKG